MQDVTIYHNARCSKSRQAMDLLAGRELDANVVDYLTNPPTIDELDRICRKLGVEPVEIIRTKEQRFADLGLSIADDRDRMGWLEVLVANPILIERPIVVVGDRAAIGRPVERVADLLSD